MSNESKHGHRHILATIWLSIILAGNAVASPVYLIGNSELKKVLPQAPDIFWQICGVLGMVVVACCVALFMWKKWGFWVICMISTVVTVAELVMGFGFASFIGPAAVLLLFGLLNLGGDNSAWKHLT